MYESEVKECMSLVNETIKSKRQFILDYLSTEIYVRNQYDGHIGHYELKVDENEGRKIWYLGRNGNIDESMSIEDFFKNEFVKNNLRYTKRLKNGKLTKRHKKYLAVAQGIVYTAVKQIADFSIIDFAKKLYFDDAEQKAFLEKAFKEVDYFELSKRFFSTPEYFNYSMRNLSYLLETGNKYSSAYVNLLSMNSIGANNGNIMMFERIYNNE